ncbi:TPA: hypothetical protein ACID5V_004145 [Pseudomonas aeruginosa]|uniref:DUF2158 domain-containing protein n=3 Tax=Pseudomonas TaxID=286 RepID=A0A3S4RKR7_PSEFL|nr:hypothetical protein [Pseudomonas aeruginosa]VEE45741.1 Uncharacterised protein [Pseudomonas fluorescens]ELS0939118.1 hypothetical protein [Pseudomonas aeruginosa]EME90393.1 hypothetical protein H123_29791 [Pseudomonas aeruginosa PA21_ST175]KSM66962.1 hypothetical protein APA68_29045 [Pseudomonas aeruginosa]KSO12771.1 hypothetical protein APA92_26535 [Pseudomonas aeruginosa]
MSKFKAGDLALIVSAQYEENLGTVVQLVRVDGFYSLISGETSWLVEGEGRGCYCRESALIPLRGDFQPEQQKAKEVEA